MMMSSRVGFLKAILKPNSSSMKAMGQMPMRLFSVEITSTIKNSDKCKLFFFIRL